MTLQELTRSIASFSAERDWGQFHSPKNLAMALSVEASEIVELFQWRAEAESRALEDATREAVADEIADVLIYLVRLADELGIAPLLAAERKMLKNAAKYPADKVRGRTDKYSEYE